VIITIEQLDKAGNVWRTFTQYPRNASELDGKLHRIGRAYNLDHTRVSVDGVDITRDLP
jgi:hypothetical protein